LSDFVDVIRVLPLGQIATFMLCQNVRRHVYVSVHCQ